MIIVSGFNVYFWDIEEVLYEYSYIKEVVVIGVLYFYRGEIIKVILVVKEGKFFFEEEFIFYCW